MPTLESVRRCGEVASRMTPEEAVARLRSRGRPSLLLDGRADPTEGWVTRVAAWARALEQVHGEHRADEALERLDRAVALRRAAGGPPGTGIAALLAYDALDRPADRVGDLEPRLLAFEVDASLTFERSGEVRLETSWPGDPEAPQAVLRRLTAGAWSERPRARTIGRPRTSLPRERYLRAVERIKGRIREGDIYQANLTQTFEIGWAGDALQLHAALFAAAPAPRAAFVECGGLALASASPETFVVARPDGTVETRPIKGTRRRGATSGEDRALAAELLASEKDRAELLMIVDLERNDLGRVCETGSVEVVELWGLRTYAAVHHLVATVRGELRAGTGPRSLLEAVFPGGSVTGAPKLRAIEILREVEPVPRGLYTGALFWFGDDGTTESSLLIRSVVVAGGRARLGAGGGIVADSDPESEWNESNEKARPLARVVGFDPEEAR